ncbi:uncharacterized protein ALTATR162_LOCUS4507 [Alternaria atra]|uniref:Uncharacterized protein n=1 Tax=Alternaria atra TaxID=119953 RepID=A0A8J2I5W6_9PLEO|nr:uncharacterized protein ALTATR162_LOCUS4507 [Alternaria atra]CAG5156710.1 unnamed protein product [Alternaria atra]
MKVSTILYLMGITSLVSAAPQEDDKPEVPAFPSFSRRPVPSYSRVPLPSFSRGPIPLPTALPPFPTGAPPRPTGGLPPRPSSPVSEPLIRYLGPPYAFGSPFSLSYSCAFSSH